MSEIATIRPRTAHHSRFPLVLYAARRDLSRRYAGSLLGATWALAFPLLQLAVYWAVAFYGLRIGGSGGLPLAAMLIAGMAPWFALSDALGSMTRAFTGNAALLKRLMVPAEILPLASLVAALMVHGAVLTIVVVALWSIGHPPAPRLLVLIYFVGCVSVFALALGTILALANAALRDVGQIVGPLLFLWFWATPIVWPAERLPERLQLAVAWNPLAYLVEGYRFALLGPPAKLPSGDATAAFWIVTGLLCLAAWASFARFKRELGDYL